MFVHFSVAILSLKRDGQAIKNAQFNGKGA